MGVLCFCNGICKSEKTKCSILSVKGLSMARVSNGSGFLIHRNLLLTSHAVLPSLAAAQAAEIHLQNGAAALLVPNRCWLKGFDKHSR
ncbi:hypothetical protein Tco_1486862 [Tanacetum coccineum]